MRKTRNRAHPAGAARFGTLAAIAVVAAVTASAASLLHCAVPAPPPAGAPRLLVMIVVDQMRADYLDRFAPHFTGGLKRLLDEGVRFTEAHHAHAITNTGPGHATVSTGCHPARHGVINNYWFDRETGEEVYSAEDDSARMLECEALGTWLKGRYPRAKVYSASIKDRSAILLGGREADAAFWYDWEGGFETSEAYLDDAPQWLTDFGAERHLDRHYGQAWSPARNETWWFDDAELEAMGIEAFDFGPLHPDAPHVFGGLAGAPDESFWGSLYYSPHFDEHLARLALRIVEEEELGEDEVPDLLALGFSALDAVGHRFGPNSPEVLETVLALDRSLGSLFEELDRRIGFDRIAVGLTSDHGVPPAPELWAEWGHEEGSRVGSDEILCVQGLERGLDERLGEADWLRPGPILRPEAVVAAGLDSAQAERVAAEILAECPRVARVWTRGELLSAGGTEQGPARDRFLAAYHPERSPDLLIEWDALFLRSRSSASSHGSPHRYDTWVPLIFTGPGVEAGESAEPVRTVDLAPTLAAFAEVAPPAEIDGVDLQPAGRSSDGD